MNTLAYIKLNRPTGEELDHSKRNAWLFVRAEEGKSHIDAIAEMKLFSSICEAEGFHIIGESVFIGNETGAEHFLKSFIPRILFVDCIVSPSIQDVASNSRNALSVVDMLQNEGVDLFTMIDGELFKTSSTIYPYFIFRANRLEISGWLFFYFQNYLQGVRELIFTENRYDRSIERMMKGVPNFYPRSSGIVVTGIFRYTAEMCDCEYCGYYGGKKKGCLVPKCVCLEERISVGIAY